MNDNLIELTINQKKETFEILLRFHFNECDYIALSPQDDKDSAAIFQIKKAPNSEEIYETIENIKLAKQVFVHFISIWELPEDDE